MADELNIPTHRWYQKRNHIALAKEDVSRQYIYDSGIQKIDAWINSQPWGDVYIVNRLSPNLVFDFDATYYRTDGTATDLVSAATHTRAGNATMVDSDGFRKWAPHNFLTYSEQFDNAGWAKQVGITVSANQITAPDGTVTADKIVSASNTVEKSLNQPLSISGVKETVAVFLRQGEWDYGFIRLRNSTGFVNAFYDLSSGQVVSAGAGLENTSITAFPNGWYLCQTDATRETTPNASFGASSSGSSISDLGDGTSGIFIWGAHAYRSDLGGMVNNPATGDSYVPTTDSARYLPRVGHHIWNGSAWVDEGYFHESEARTNLLTYSSEFDNAAWTKTQSSVDPEATTAPDGTQTADKFEDAVTGNNYAQIRKVASATSSGLAYTWTVYAKAEEHTFIHLNIEAGTYVGGVYFNLSTGQKGTEIGGATGEIVSLGSGWYRCSVSFVANTAHNLAMYSSDSDNTIFATRAIGFGIYIWGAQLEEGSTPSSYIPTAGATVTRAADAMTIPAANLPWNPLAVSIQMEGTVTGVSSTFANWTEDASNGILMQSGASNFTFTQEAAGVVDTVTGGSYTSGINVPFNISSRHGSTFINGAVDGTALTANTTPAALPDLSSTDMQIGSTFMGTIKLLRVWADDLTDEGIAEGSSNV